jgi:CRISPR/Cas system CSM-associated protein Csm2 small subunit
MKQKELEKLIENRVRAIVSENLNEESLNSLLESVITLSQDVHLADTIKQCYKHYINCYTLLKREFDKTHDTKLVNYMKDFHNIFMSIVEYLKNNQGK